jgi:hypothetical protein
MRERYFRWSDLLFLLDCPFWCFFGEVMGMIFSGLVKSNAHHGFIVWFLIQPIRLQ